MAEIAKIHGNDIRDKKLVDAQVSTTPSDVTSNSVIPVEAEDGTIIKLKRDSLVQAFASVLNSNSQSTITTLFGADSNGNHANINMSNLASVLSAASVVHLGDPANIDELGEGIIIFNAHSNAVGMPSGCQEIVGIHVRRELGNYAGFQIGIGHYSDGDQIIGRKVWAATSSWQNWTKIF